MKTVSSKSPERESRYMTSTKKRYYLASVDENVQMLVKEQIEELTNVLIGLKSEYDALTRETNIKNKEANELSTKIKMMRKIEQKAKKKIENANHMNKAMNGVSGTKKTKLEEVKYEKTTLLSQIEKLKSDLLVIQKDLNQTDIITRKVKKENEKERAKETAIKEQYNGIYSKIQSQMSKNNFEKNEQTLQLQYYNTIIDQKNAFIRSADERKERQLKIAQDAKNDSLDKQEIDKRSQLCMLLLFDKYIKNKMDKELHENENLEDTFQKIRDICGTSNLKIMIDIILNKDKRYNTHVAKVKEKENHIENMQQDIDELEEQLKQLKNDILVKDITDVKKVEPVETSIIESDEKKKIQEEIRLKMEFAKLQEKHKDICLTYERVVQNIKALSKDIQPSISTIQVNTFETLPEIEKEEQPIQTVSNPELFSEVNNNNTENANYIETKVDTTQAQEVVPARNISEDEEKIHGLFADFLANSLKKFEILFLCHSKQEFLNLMRQKGFEFAYSMEATKIPSKILKQKKTVRMKTEPDNGNLEDVDAFDPTILPTEKNEQKMIFYSFINGMKSKKEEFTKIRSVKPSQH